MIKWDNYKVVCTMMSNEIVIAKMKNSSKFPVIDDKSDDKTSEVINTVYQHMQGSFEQIKVENSEVKSMVLTFGDGGQLIYKPGGEGADTE
ncbi:hypothetical protein NKT34_13715 [Paenibacillus polysaccharolyticus]|uniref:DUF7446 family protein n=1 Tax=Paenibacillus polysaccharolyticus TaxID=582692 RepID=UPI0020A1F19B|nr:hypothetical protein [Paenibacillus polysaccharolyticus]MCP1134357.1 hypothetical protein [Paenibacillus polysaccharolyticus]